MTGFLALAAAYLAAWVLLLAPATYVMLRPRRHLVIPDDRPSAEWRIGVAMRDLVARAMPAERIEVVEPPRRGRAPAASGHAVRIDGHVTIPEDAIVATGLVVDGNLTCGPGSRILGPVRASGRVLLREGARIDGPVAADGAVRVDPEARIERPVASRRRIVLAPGGWVLTALAPVVAGVPLHDEDVEPVPEHRPIGPPDWTPELDSALDELWPARPLHAIVEEFAGSTGVDVRGVELLRRARALGLNDRGIPSRPRFLGRRPVWVLTPEAIRVGADLRIAPAERISYSLVVEGALEVFHDAELEAGVRSGRGMLLHPGVVVHGPAVSDGLIVCEDGAAVWGPIDSSTHVVLFANSRAGLAGSGGVSALGAIGLEPGAEITGGAVAGLGVRGEPLRPGRVRERARRRPEPTIVQPRAPRRRRRRSGPSGSSRWADGSRPAPR